ncbi:MAG: hypothetical protein EHM58_04955 [Ignavibacteriae bacterium]|nr:MAG: hypothetical protein EHM58_04955 [Ignavibacteriota bacterium]
MSINYKLKLIIAFLVVFGMAYICSSSKDDTKKEQTKEETKKEDTKKEDTKREETKTDDTRRESRGSARIYFCEDVDKDGYPITESSVFNISRSGGYFNFLIRLSDAINCRSVRYEIYKENSSGSEVYNTTIYQDTEKDWVWFYKQVTFYDPGNYNVYVYDCDNNKITTGNVKIKYR